MPTFMHSTAQEGDYVLVNSYEESVLESVSAMAQDMNMCTCEKCISDACAIVLNQLMPKYVTTRKGELISKANQNVQVEKIDLTVRVIQALTQVKESPSH